MKMERVSTIRSGVSRVAIVSPIILISRTHEQKLYLFRIG